MADGVVFLPSFHEAIRELPDEERLLAYDAIANYGLYGEVIEMTPVVKAMFSLMRPIIDSSQNRYRASKENGSKPPKDPERPRGRPRKNQTENQTDFQSRNQDIEKEKDYDFYSDSAIEREGESVRGGGGAWPVYRPLKEDAFEKQREAQLAKLGVTW